MTVRSVGDELVNMTAAAQRLKSRVRAGQVVLSKDDETNLLNLIETDIRREWLRYRLAQSVVREQRAAPARSVVTTINAQANVIRQIGREMAAELAALDAAEGC